MVITQETPQATAMDDQFGTHRVGEETTQAGHTRASAASALQPVKEDAATHSAVAVALCSAWRRDHGRRCPQGDLVLFTRAQRAVPRPHIDSSQVLTVVRSRSALVVGTGGGLRGTSDDVDRHSVASGDAACTQCVPGRPRAWQVWKIGSSTVSNSQINPAAEEGLSRT
jgi:hypothetical protein